MSSYGLIGNNISYSLSPKLHYIIAKYYSVEISYKLYDVGQQSLEVLLNTSTAKGFNVTQPYKQVLFDMVDNKDSVATKIGAINTIIIKDQLSTGYNTDYYGLLELFKYYNLNLTDKKILILGTGGAALASYYAAFNFTNNIIFVSRDKTLKKLPSITINYNDISNYQYDVIINATPIGTYPNIEDSPLDRSLVNNKIVIDLIYNPKETKLMSYSTESYNGMVMLIAQAIHTQRIWFGIDFLINKEIITKIKELLLNE